jgi:hypothetical protein
MGAGCEGRKRRGGKECGDGLKGVGYQERRKELRAGASSKRRGEGHIVHVCWGRSHCSRVLWNL